MFFLSHSGRMKKHSKNKKTGSFPHSLSCGDPWLSLLRPKRGASSEALHICTWCTDPSFRFQAVPDSRTGDIRENKKQETHCWFGGTQSSLVGLLAYSFESSDSFSVYCIQDSQLHSLGETEWSLPTPQDFPLISSLVSILGRRLFREILQARTEQPVKNVDKLDFLPPLSLSVTKNFPRTSHLVCFPHLGWKI